MNWLKWFTRFDESYIWKFLREIFREVERSQHWRPDLTMTFMASSRSSGRSSSSKDELRNIFKVEWDFWWIESVDELTSPKLFKGILWQSCFFCLCGFMVLDYVPSQLSAIGLLSCNSQLSSPPPPLGTAVSRKWKTEKKVRNPILAQFLPSTVWLTNMLGGSPE